MSYPKGRTKFVVAGVSPYLSMVRNHLIHSGWQLIPWSESLAADYAIIGADLNCESDHPPVAQIEMQLMNICGGTVILSSPLLTVPNPDLNEWSPEARATWLYAKTVEHMFDVAHNTLPTLAVRPVNVYGPSIKKDVVACAIANSVACKELYTPGRSTRKNTFIYETDFLDALDHLITAGASGNVDISWGEMTNQNVLRTIWKFINGADLEPTIISEQLPWYDFLANVDVLEELGWKPQYSVRAGLHEVCNTTIKTSIAMI